MAEFITIRASAGTCRLSRQEPIENLPGVAFAGPLPFKHVDPHHQEFHFGLITGVEIIMWIQDAHAAIQKRCFQHVKDVVRAQVRSFSFYLHNRSSLSLNLGMTSRYPKGGVQNAFHFDHTCQAF